MTEQQEKPRLARRFAALLGFFRTEAAGGAVLIAAAIAALVWSNSDASPDYFALLDLPLAVGIGQATFSQSVFAWINDGLMAFFFLLVGLEIRREMIEGQLATLPRLAAPGIAALGGMAVPAAIYVAFNHANPAALRGWAIPIATDIAFSLAALSVLGRRVPVSLKVFLTALAIIDDLGAIIVIAVFYTEHLAFGALAIAVILWLALFAMARLGVRAVTPYAIGGVALWAAVLGSGIHPTIAGVALAFVVPMDEREDGPESPARRMQAGLDNWVAYGVLPLFGLANAGLRLGAMPADVVTRPVVLGVALGLVIGKQVGVFGATLAAVKLGLAHLPERLSLGQLYGGALLCGIGFTMSLFIGDLAFGTRPAGLEAKLAVLAASVISALLGIAMLALATRRGPARR